VNPILPEFWYAFLPGLSLSISFEQFMTLALNLGCFLTGFRSIHGVGGFNAAWFIFPSRIFMQIKPQNL
jgi:hypothetical protein